MRVAWRGDPGIVFWILISDPDAFVTEQKDAARHQEARREIRHPSLESQVDSGR